MNYLDDEINKPSILLDGECGLCNKFAGFMHRRLRDKKGAQFFGIESEVGQAMISTFPTELQKLDTVYFVNHESIKTKSSAVINCLGLMRFPYRFISFVIWLVPRFVRDAVYDFVAKRRKSVFGTTDMCVWDDFPSNQETGK
ncbi:MAG: hypothetical protein CL431_03365 [Acidimicrobiaceae bacterium]|jgi:predicted DCC family thiol-disulfide oxidoreductase YuxK|nr:hypothetical protein [Acidimicrobiaceae bacterium]|tara:strand:- start:2920 stop:3345 length:426 start_codon:yes stop_codon:yes gene_type:complete